MSNQPIIALLFAVFSVLSLYAKPVELPFGLRWGDRPSKILDWAQAEKLNATIELPGDDSRLRVIHVTSTTGGLPGQKIHELTTSYRDGRLFEIVLHYSGDGKPIPVIKGRFLELKRQLGRNFGVFQTNRIDRSNEDSVRTTSESYHAEPSPGILIIGVYSEVFDDLRKKGDAKFSFIYRNQNLEKALQTPQTSAVGQ